MAVGARQRVLLWALAINAVMFIGELGAGLAAHSSALMADSLDMLIDALAYAATLYVLLRGSRSRAKSGLFSAVLELILALGIVGDTLIRWKVGITPEPLTIMSVGALALLANLGVAALLMRHRDTDISMRAVWLCTRNDALGNLGAIAAGGAIFAWKTAWPDWIVGIVLAIVIVVTSLGLCREAWQELRQDASAGC